ncbi:hypothetical protein CEUSTIGMA_g11818.t1 [Chlamydomonas eustigma]|uniref:RNA helicase n=1 Tax=Chlamydomonas eustigma TaxID=1157962 RepID=A0A250XMZ8_9CHLO|nr:hypothetical protein CEUSTIGMA_g11818.t1 [Chlamydomonas eustigma]|eukprot:GAX84396.1 hypothetical protein CEUSTIGMA_g11818.t1 [Chlamydomonas eustigma]
MSQKRCRTFFNLGASNDMTDAIEAIAETLRNLAGCALFSESVFSTADATSTIKLLMETVRDSPNVCSSTQLIPLMGAALVKAWCYNRAHLNINAVPPPGLLLVAQSAAIKDVSKDIWVDDDLTAVYKEPLSKRKAHAPESSASIGKDSKTNKNPLAGVPNCDIASLLLKQLQEPPIQLKLFQKFVEEFGSQGIWELLQAVNKQIKEKSPDSLTVDGKPRTAGGVFIKLAAKRRSEIKMNRGKSSADVPQFTLRAYQVEAVEKILCSKGGNWVVAAPTNAGKTAIFIEITKHLLRKNPAAKTLILVPTISLAGQQCAAYEKAGFGKVPVKSRTSSRMDKSSKAADESFFSGVQTADRKTLVSAALRNQPTNETPLASQEFSMHRVDWFCSDRQLHPDHWREELQRLSVLVMESGSMRNLLVCGAARLEDLDLVVLDECHHTTKEHAYAKVMSYYDSSASKPQILGFSASPAGGSTVAKVHANLEDLLLRLNANLHVVPEEQVQEVAPSPLEQVCVVESRDEDRTMWMTLRERMVVTALNIGASLNRLSKIATTHPSSKMELWHNTELLNKAVSDLNNVSAFQDVCSWANETRELAAAWQLPRLGVCVVLVEVLRRGSDILIDTGREAALQFVCRELLNLAVYMKVLVTRLSNLKAIVGSSQTASENSVDSMSSWMARLMRNCGFEDDIELPEDEEPNTGEGVPHSPDAVKASLLDQLPDLKDRVVNGPSPTAIAISAASLRNKVLSKIPAPEDIDIDPVELFRDVLKGLRILGDGTSPLSDTLQAAGMDLVASTVGAIVPGYLRPAPACHPKIWELVQYIRRYSDQEAFHGIIFSRTRQGAYYLADVLRAASAPVVLPSRGTASDPAIGNLSSPTRASRANLTSVLSYKNGDSYPKSQSDDMNDSLVPNSQHVYVSSEMQPMSVDDVDKQDPYSAHHGVVLASCSSSHVLECTVPEPGPASAGDEPLLGFVQSVHVFVGHGESSTKRDGWLNRGGGDGSLENSSELVSKGMSANKQQSVLEQFKAPGRRLLIATTAAEEGLDVPCCEFVVRFSPAASGIQRVQARGRGRKLGSVYFCLVQKGGEAKDEKLHNKSEREEVAMKIAMAERTVGGVAC